MTEEDQLAQGAKTLSTPAERMYYAWDGALSRNDAAALTALYAFDAAIESPLIPHLMGTEKGICRGHEELRAFFEKVASSKPQERRYHRTGYLTDGNKVIGEYPREAPDGDQMDFVQVMELNKEGLIQKHLRQLGLVRFRRSKKGRVSQMKEPYDDTPRYLSRAPLSTVLVKTG